MGFGDLHFDFRESLPDFLSQNRNHRIFRVEMSRVNEIHTSIDADPRACYFRQALYGKYIRMALILKLLEVNV